MNETKTMITDGDRLREWRVEHGWSQTELGQRLGMGQPAVSMFEGGSRPNTPQLRLAMLKVFGAEVFNLIFQDEDLPATPANGTNGTGASKGGGNGAA